MKNWSLIILTLISYISASAQNSPGMPAGDIGIGITTPNAPLHVQSTGIVLGRFYNNVRGAGGGPQLILGSYVDGIGTISNDRLGGLNFSGAMTGATTTAAASIAGFAEGTFTASSLPSSLRFYTTASASAVLSERMRITQAGNVGIGTAAPSAKLDVYEIGTIIPAVRLQDGDLTIPNYSAVGFNPALTANTVGQISSLGAAIGGINLSGFSNTTDSRAATVAGYSGKTTVDLPVVNFIARKHNGATNYASLAGTEPAFEFLNSSTSLIRILGNGSVGIGTTAPASLFHINAATTMTPIITLSGVDVAHPFTGLAAAGIGGKVYAHGSVGGLVEQGFTDIDNPAVRIQGYVGSTAPTKPAFLLEAFKSNGANNRASFTGTEIVLLAGTGDLYTTPTAASFAILGNGNVGIGTIAPQAKLAVNGDIFSKKVKVLQTGWPDYVFHKSYHLLPLAEVETFIKTHHHLPEVSSAAEVEKNGLDLGDNQATLLKKIEELTLYLIEEHKNMSQLKHMLTAQQKEMDMLKKEIQRFKKEKENIVR